MDARYGPFVERYVEIFVAHFYPILGQTSSRLSFTSADTSGMIWASSEGRENVREKFEEILFCWVTEFQRWHGFSTLGLKRFHTEVFTVKFGGS